MTTARASHDTVPSQLSVNNDAAAPGIDVRISGPSALVLAIAVAAMLRGATRPRVRRRVKAVGRARIAA